MALLKSTIKSEIKTAFTAVMNDEGDRSDAIDRVADKLSDAVINAIKSAKITYSSGLVAPSGGGAVSGTFTYTIT